MTLILLSKICGLMIFVYCVCRLSGRQYRYLNLSLWAHLFLIPSAVAMILTQITPTMESMIFRLGVALYFASQTWKIWRLQQRFYKNKPPNFTPNAQSKPKLKIKLKLTHDK